MTTILASVIIFGILIFFHEFGHYFAAKRAGIGVLEFAIGFGPKLISFKKDGTRYSFRIIPLGGFCRLVGEEPEEAEQENSFQNKSLKDRLAVIAAGPVMNFVLAALLFFLILFIFGIPTNGLGEVLPESRAARAGLQPGDVILAIDGREVKSWENIVQTINNSSDKMLIFTIERDGEIKEIGVTPRKDPQTERGLIGIAPQIKKYVFFSSLRLAVSNTWWFTRLIVVNVAQMFSGQAPPDVAGPIGIVQMVGEVAQTGISNLMALAAILSIHLGLINLLPIPALDGSRLVFFLIEGVRGKPIDPDKESLIHLIGFAFLIFLTIIIAFKDLVRLELF